VGDEHQPFTVESVRLRESDAVLKLTECQSQSDAEELRGKYLWIPLEEAMPLEDGAYYLHEIVGLRVCTTQGDYIGEVKDVLVTPGNDVYVVQGDGSEILIPAISSVVREVNRAEGKMVVEPMEGLF
jgi:16S rRNA processing protein RimM